MCTNFMVELIDEPLCIVYIGKVSSYIGSSVPLRSSARKGLQFFWVCCQATYLSSILAN